MLPDQKRILKAEAYNGGVAEMTFVSILDKEESTYKDRRPDPAYLKDLNLNRILERIQFLWPEEIMEFFRYFPENEDCETYRREVYEDVRNPVLRQALTDFVEQMRERSRAMVNQTKVETELQKGIWHLWEVYHYCSALECLHGKLEAQVPFPVSEDKPGSRGLLELTKYLGVQLADAEFLDMKNRCFALVARLQDTHLILKIENDRLFIGEGETKGRYEEFLRQSFPGKNGKLRSPFATGYGLSSLEKEAFRIFSRKNSELFEEILEFSRIYTSYADKVLLRFFREIGFYLAFYKFETQMAADGFVFSVPETNSDREFKAEGLYDLALAYTLGKQGKKIVSNSMAYGEKERFFILTGPNQGGKTTFARSLGQLVYFTKLGLSVPAQSANVPYFSDILSHFSVEESIATGHGKLKEELIRLRPMMQDNVKNAFVIFNELFTTAANYDACIMGKRVLEHFSNQGCCGIYVTHLKELSDGETFVGLRALVEKETASARTEGETGETPTVTGTRHIRTYKIIRSQSDNLGYARDLVEAHGLTYEQAKVRIRRMLKEGE
jgi:hypothetical protein